MTRFVTFNGITRFQPGGITKIDATALAPIGLTASGIVALIGEADGGTPGEVITIDDPVLAKATFRSGPLADAIRVAFDPSSDIRIPGGAFRVLAYKTNTTGAAQGETQLPGDGSIFTDTAAGVPTTTVIQLTTNTTMVVNVHAGRWFQLTATSERRRIVSNTVDTVTVSPGFNTAPSAGADVAILQSQIELTARDYGSHTNTISVKIEDGVTTNTKVVTTAFEGITEQSGEIAGTKYLKMKYVGGPIPANGTGTITSIASDGITIVFNPAGAPTLDAWAGMVLQFSDGTQRLIATNSAADPSTVVLDAAHALSAAKQVSLVGTTANVRDVTAATATIVGAQGVATSMTSTVTPTADNLNLTFAVNETLRAFVDRVNATTNYELEIVDGINPDTTLMKNFDFGTNATAVNIRFDDEINPNTTGHFRQDLQEMVDWFNDFSTYLTAAKATGTGQEGSELPMNTNFTGIIGSDTISLVNGVRGTSTNSTWQTGFDALMNVRANFVVPLISQDLVNEGFGSTATFASVAAQLKAHVQEARGVGQSERGGFLGMAGTMTEVIEQAAALNDTDVQLIPQKITTLNVDANLVEMDEWAAAVTAAGMRAGAPEVGTPLTFKLLKTTALSSDDTIDPTDLTDINALLAGGVMFAQPAPNGGFRWVRDLTTYLLDDNIAFMDAHTREAVRFVAYDLRNHLEERFTGLKATPATVASLREATAAKLRTYLASNIIVESRDPQNPTSTAVIPGFRNLKVSVTGNVASIRFEMFPVTGIVFELITINLQLPIIVAA